MTIEIGYTLLTDMSSGGFADVTKWAGACFVDVSSGVGGFCLLEDNDTAYWDCNDIDSEENFDSAQVLLDMNDPYPDVMALDYGSPVNIFWQRTTSDLDNPDPSLWEIDLLNPYG